MDTGGPLGTIGSSPRVARCIGSDRFRCPLQGFGRHLQIGEQFHLPAPVIEGRVLAHRRQHPPYAGRRFGVLHIEFEIGRALAAMTVRAQIVGTRYFHLAYGGEQRLGALFPVLRLLAAGTSDGAPGGGGRGEPQ